MSPTVRLYGRAGCHLCDEAEALLARLAAETGFALEKVDIEHDPALEYRYQWAIPVVELDGVELARAPLRADALEEALRERLR